jgi:C-terminal processing protease CtpA/Prc
MMLISFNNFKEGTKQEPVEVTLQESEGDAEKPMETSASIIPKEDEGIEEEIESDKGYYGIGITTHDYFLDGKFVVEIIMVSYGYPADLAGLQAGDIIIEINSLPISTGQEIRGEGKTPLTLKVIKKNGTITFIRLTRDFIRTEH